MATRPTRVALLTIILTLLLGCWFSRFEDVSDDPRYSSYIGRTYQSVAESLLIAVTMERDYAPILDHYVIAPLPGFTGPEVLSRAPLPPGTLLRVARVERCTNCLPFENRIELIVVIEGITNKDAAVRLSLKALDAEAPLFLQTGPD